MLRYASVFIKKVPKPTLAALKSSSFKSIDIPKLIPSFMSSLKAEAIDDALSYVVDHCIKRRKSKDKTVHNLAFFFYAERNQPDDLLDFLKSEEARK